MPLLGSLCPGKFGKLAMFYMFVCLSVFLFVCLFVCVVPLSMAWLSILCSKEVWALTSYTKDVGYLVFISVV